MRPKRRFQGNHYFVSEIGVSSETIRPMSTAVRNRWIAPLIVVACGGIPFSLCLLRLGIDMASPELLRYVLIASAPFVAILTSNALKFGNRKEMLRSIEILKWSFLMCVPLEALTYLYVAWGLKGADLFSPHELPTLVVMLSAWALILAVSSSILAAFIPALRAGE